MSRAIAAAQPLIASEAPDGHRRERQSRRTLIDAQRQSKKRAQENACRTSDSRGSCPRYRPPPHILIAAAVLIQIVALHRTSEPIVEENNRQNRDQTQQIESLDSGQTFC